MMSIRFLAGISLCLCLSLVLSQARAQEPVSVQVWVGKPKQKPLQNWEELPRYQAGVEVGRSPAFLLGMFRDWKAPLPLEGVIQYRLREMPVYAQLYGGYFRGGLHYDNGSELLQTAFYLKPGLMKVFANEGLRHGSFTVEANLIFSLGNIRGENTIPGPVFGSYEASASLAVESFGVEAGIGTDVVVVGPYKLKTLLRMYLCAVPERKVPYIPGVGYATHSGFGIGLNFYLMRAWGK